MYLQAPPGSPGGLYVVLHVALHPRSVSCVRGLGVRVRAAAALWRAFLSACLGTLVRLSVPGWFPSTRNEISPCSFVEAPSNVDDVVDCQVEIPEWPMGLCGCLGDLS